MIGDTEKHLVAGERKCRETLALVFLGPSPALNSLPWPHFGEVLNVVSGRISPLFWSLDLPGAQLTSSKSPKPSSGWGPKSLSCPAQALWLWQLKNAFSLKFPGFKVGGLLLARNKLLWVLNCSFLSPDSQMGSWMSHFWWLALNRKFCKWFLAGALITFLLRFISTAEFSFAFFLSVPCN